MTRLVLLAMLVLGLGACDKPSAESCRKALINMQHLSGNESTDEAALAGGVRQCTSGSSKKSVECATKAQTLDELRHCEFYKVPPSATPTGSAAPTPTPGSAAPTPTPTPTTGSAAPAGSAGSGSAG